jgi:hypothetical protein
LAYLNPLFCVKLRRLTKKDIAASDGTEVVYSKVSTIDTLCLCGTIFWHDRYVRCWIFRWAFLTAMTRSTGFSQSFNTDGVWTAFVSEFGHREINTLSTSHIAIVRLNSVTSFRVFSGAPCEACSSLILFSSSTSSARRNRTPAGLLQR